MDDKVIKIEGKNIKVYSFIIIFGFIILAIIVIIFEESLIRTGGMIIQSVYFYYLMSNEPFVESLQFTNDQLIIQSYFPLQAEKHRKITIPISTIKEIDIQKKEGALFPDHYSLIVVSTSREDVCSKFYYTGVEIKQFIKEIRDKVTANN